MRYLRFVATRALLRLAAVIAVVAAVPGCTPSPISPTPAGPPPPETFPEEDELLALVNEYRAAGATCGGTRYGPAPALVMNEALLRAARAHSQDMAEKDYFSHDSLDGRTPRERIRAAGYSGSRTGENIIAGVAFRSATAVVGVWMRSPNHCVNIMSPRFDSMGAGRAFGGSYGIYWTQTFGGN